MLLLVFSFAPVLSIPWRESSLSYSSDCALPAWRTSPSQMWFHFYNHIVLVLYLPWCTFEYASLQIVLHMHCNKPVKVPLTLVHYRKHCAWTRYLDVNTALRFASYYLVLLIMSVCNISCSAFSAIL